MRLTPSSRPATANRDDEGIGASVRAALPAALAEKLHDVELVLGRPVTFLEEACLRGEAAGSARPDGVITLASRAVHNFSVIGEEIMHLHRWTRGYPAIEPTTLAWKAGYAPALQRLSGHFDEYAFFPFLEDLGLSPRGDVAPALQPQLEAIEELIPKLQQERDNPRWRIQLPVVFVQAALLAPDGPERDALLKKFGDSALADAAEVGRALCAEIVAAQNETPADVERRMQKSLENYLGVHAKGAVVRKFPYLLK